MNYCAVCLIREDIISFGHNSTIEMVTVDLPCRKNYSYGLDFFLSFSKGKIFTTDCTSTSPVIQIHTDNRSHMNGTLLAIVVKNKRNLKSVCKFVLAP